MSVILFRFTNKSSQSDYSGFIVHAWPILACVSLKLWKTYRARKKKTFFYLTIILGNGAEDGLVEQDNCFNIQRFENKHRFSAEKLEMMFILARNYVYRRIRELKHRRRRRQ